MAQGDDGRVLLYCHAGCSTEEIVAALDLELGDLFEQESTGAGKPGNADASAGLTLAQLAQAKRLPVDFLKSLGCTDGPGPCVRIPYHDADGNAVSIRSRMALTGDRFRWRRGDRLIPYGLNRLADARAAGWVPLAEGESDCWTAWYLGIPALGIPGKSTWRAEWAQYLTGLEVVLWQEPDAADLVERIGRDLPDARILVAPSGVKDISEAHLLGLDVAALLERLRVDARTARDLVAERAEERLRESCAQAGPVLAHADPLILVEQEVRAQGYGGDTRAPMLGYLAMTSRVLARRRGALPGHMLFKGASSGGKNATIQAGLRLLPEQAFHVIDAGSPRVLIYDDEPLKHRVVVFSEADSLPAGEDNPAASAIRNLAQDGYLHYKVTERDPETGRHGVRTVMKEGPSVLITTSTRSLDTQMMTRLFTVEVPDEPAHIRAALEAIAAMELDEPPAPDEGLIAFQLYLQAKAPIDVVVPFVNEIGGYLGRMPDGPRVLRDFPRLLSLIKAAAVMRIGHRTRDERGRLVATIDDYSAVYDLVADTYQATAGASQRVRDAVAAVASLTAGKGFESTVTVSEVARHLGISIPSASRRVRDALAGRWLVNDETRRSQTAKLRVGESMPSESLLPSPSDLGALIDANAAEHVKTHNASQPHETTGVFTFSPNTDGYSGDAGMRGQGRGAYPTLNPEIVKTPPGSVANRGFDDFSAANREQPEAAEWVDVAPEEPNVEAVEDGDDLSGPLTLWDLQ